MLWSKCEISPTGACTLPPGPQSVAHVWEGPSGLEAYLVDMAVGSEPKHRSSTGLQAQFLFFLNATIYFHYNGYELFMLPCLFTVMMDPKWSVLERLECDEKNIQN